MGWKTMDANKTRLINYVEKPTEQKCYVILILILRKEDFFI